MSVLIRVGMLKVWKMVPAEVVRDLSLIAEIVNMGETPEKLSKSWIGDLIDRYGITYKPAITDADRDDLLRLADEFRIIFSMQADDLADFSNRVLEKIRFSPRIKNHGGFGWHIHYFDEDFSFGGRTRSNAAMSIMSLIVHEEASRLKTCKAITCSKVFVDTTRNSSKAYCDVKTCGNRAHVAHFRARSLKPALQG